MKRYYIKYYNDFSNAYNLVWAETPEQIAMAEADGIGWERISRREAEKKCSAENERRKYDCSFSGYADSAIYPIDYDGCAVNDPRMYKDGYLWLYR